MNLIDFHVTEVLGPPVKRTTIDGREYWVTPVVYWDDGGSGQRKEVMSFSEDHAKTIKPGYVGQH